jgi:hypothetical protein
MVREGGMAKPKPSGFARRSPTWRRRLGKRYLTLCNEAYRRGLISLGKLAEYMEVDPETALEFVEGKR